MRSDDHDSRASASSWRQACWRAGTAGATVLAAGSAAAGTGGPARVVSLPGAARLFAGERSDPFFADAEGALHGLQWTGNDTFAGTSILSIALEVPNDMLGASPVIGVWMTVSLRPDGVPDQRESHLRRPQATRRPPARVSLPRAAQPLTHQAPRSPPARVCLADPGVRLFPDPQRVQLGLEGSPVYGRGQARRAA